MVDNPATVGNYLTDPEIGPLIIQVELLIAYCLDSLLCRSMRFCKDCYLLLSEMLVVIHNTTFSAARIEP